MDAMKIYTKTGDSGTTGLVGGQRVSKSDPRIEAYGTVDELNSALGVIRIEALPRNLAELLRSIQHELFEMGAQLATPPEAKPTGCAIRAEAIRRLEQAIDELESSLPPLRQFILPAGGRAGALLHLARTVCRRAERRVVALAEVPGNRTPESIVIYLNRLSDLLFVMARLINQSGGVADEPWIKPSAAAPHERR
jgi:cob(I)alamin adenosyltransferase